MTTADRMAVLDHGVVQQVGTPQALFDEPVNSFVAGFVGSMNLLPARASGPQAVELVGIGEVPLAAAALRMPPAAAFTIGLRPHTLRLQAAQERRDDSLAWFAGTVQGSEFQGEFTRYRVQVGAHSLAVDRPHRAGQARLAMGAAVSLGIEPAQMRLLAA